MKRNLGQRWEKNKGGRFFFLSHSEEKAVNMDFFLFGLKEKSGKNKLKVKNIVEHSQKIFR